MGGGEAIEVAEIEVLETAEILEFPVISVTATAAVCVGGGVRRSVTWDKIRHGDIFVVVV